MLHSHKRNFKNRAYPKRLKKTYGAAFNCHIFKRTFDCVIVPAIQHQCNNIQCRIHQQIQYFHSKIILSRFLRIHFTKHYPNLFVFSKCFFNICNRKTILCHILLSKHKKNAPHKPSLFNLLAISASCRLRKLELLIRNLIKYACFYDNNYIFALQT